MTRPRPPRAVEPWKKKKKKRYGQITGSFEHGNEPSVSITRGEFLEYLRNC
jgi:hypothetical protein